MIIKPKAMPESTIPQVRWSAWPVIAANEGRAPANPACRIIRGSYNSRGWIDPAKINYARIEGERVSSSDWTQS